MANVPTWHVTCLRKHANDSTALPYNPCHTTLYIYSHKWHFISGAICRVPPVPLWFRSPVFNEYLVGFTTEILYELNCIAAALTSNAGIHFLSIIIVIFILFLFSTPSFHRFFTSDLSILFLIMCIKRLLSSIHSVCATSFFEENLLWNPMQICIMLPHMCARKSIRILKLSDIEKKTLW